MFNDNLRLKMSFSFISLEIKCTLGLRFFVGGYLSIR